MAIDDSLRKPGAVPFKWEIKPGVPKVQQEKRELLMSSPQKLNPPPSCSPVLSPSDPRIRSFRSASRTRSEQWRFERPVLALAETVSVGCFPSPPLRRKSTSNKKVTKKMGPDPEAEIETLSSRWSVSSQKSLFFPLHNSPSSTSSFSSNKSSPRPLNDAEWAGFGLF